MKRESGFTLVEIIIAIIVLTVGLLALVTSSALVTRMIARGQRSAMSATFAAQRLEQLRVTGCASRSRGPTCCCGAASRSTRPPGAGSTRATRTTASS